MAISPFSDGTLVLAGSGKQTIWANVLSATRLPKSSTNPRTLADQLLFWESPAFIQEGENGLLALTQFTQVNDAREHIRSIWVDHLQDKLEAILSFCSTRKVNVVVFPEYSIPIELLPWCKSLPTGSASP